jgi:hypothetical protein
MTIQIPDDLARSLEGLAAARNETIEQLALHELRSLVAPPDSPSAILKAFRSTPHANREAVDELQATIPSARLPLSPGPEFRDQ